jgi:NifU-like protein involved in Fe-S cluster formation
MDEAVSALYRKLMQEGFKNAGVIDKPTMFIDSKAEGVSICGQGKTDFMNIYITVNDRVITDVKYLCSCDPTANVVIEVLCNLAKGLSIDEAKSINKEQFYEIIGSSHGPIRQKVWGAVELLNRVIKRYEVILSPAPKAVVVENIDDMEYE